MIKQAAYGTEPWVLREKELDLDLLAQSESIFALSNGHIGLRGNLDEGDPHGLPGTYLNSMYEVRPLPYAEAGYGYPDSGHTVINVTNGKITRLPAVGVPVAGLGVGQRPDLVHGVEVGAGQPVRVPLVQVAAQPDVPVGQREDRSE